MNKIYHPFLKKIPTILSISIISIFLKSGNKEINNTICDCRDAMVIPIQEAFDNGDTLTLQKWDFLKMQELKKFVENMDMHEDFQVKIEDENIIISDISNNLTICGLAVSSRYLSSWD